MFYSIYYYQTYYSTELYFITSQNHRHSVNARGAKPTTGSIPCVYCKKFPFAAVLGKDVLTFSHKVKLSSVKTCVMRITLCVTRSCCRNDKNCVFVSLAFQPNIYKKQVMPCSKRLTHDQLKMMVILGTFYIHNLHPFLESSLAPHNSDAKL